MVGWGGGVCFGGRGGLTRLDSWETDRQGESEIGWSFLRAKPWI